MASNSDHIRNLNRYHGFKIKVLMPDDEQTRSNAKAWLTEILNTHGVLSGRLTNFILTDANNK